MNKHLILIDEQKMILYGLKSFLEASTNWKVLILASEKAELFEKLQNQNIDEKESFVAIIDIKCGDENCFELLSLLRKKISKNDRNIFKLSLNDSSTWLNYRYE